MFILASDFTIQPWKWAFDLRDISSDPDLTNQPVTLKLGVNEETGSLNRQVAFNGGGDVKIQDAKLFQPQGTIAQALDTAVREARSIDLGIQYNHWLDRDDEFKITTNIADLMARALKRIVDEYAKRPAGD